MTTTVVTPARVAETTTEVGDSGSDNSGSGGSDGSGSGGSDDSGDEEEDD
jgi:hypothetical protein